MLQEPEKQLFGEIPDRETFLSAVNRDWGGQIIPDAAVEEIIGLGHSLSLMLSIQSMKATDSKALNKSVGVLWILQTLKQERVIQVAIEPYKHLLQKKRPHK